MRENVPDVGFSLFEGSCMSFNYQHLIERTFEQRSAKNSKYTLRAFARDLSLAPSHLSGVLSGKLGLSRSSAIRIAKQLNLSPLESEAFIASVEVRHSRSQSAKALAFERLKKLRNKTLNRSTKIDVDNFRFIADWYHFAIIEALRLRDSKAHSLWIARRLGLPLRVVNSAIRRLQRLGLLKLDKGTLKPVHEESHTYSEAPSSAIREFHHQILQKSQLAISTQQLDERDYRASIMAIRKSKISAAKAMIQKFFEEFGEEIGGEIKNGHGDQEEVYVLCTQFFRLSEGKELE